MTTSTLIKTALVEKVCSTTNHLIGRDTGVHWPLLDEEVLADRSSAESEASLNRWLKLRAAKTKR